MKAQWISEIKQYADDPLTLHENSVDDIRIDSTQIKPDSEYENFHLPVQRKASYESDGIRPSEVAKNYFLTEEERVYNAKQQAENTKILQQQQKEFARQKTRAITHTKAKTQSQTNTQVQPQIKIQESNIEIQSISNISKQRTQAEISTQIKSIEKYAKPGGTAAAKSQSQSVQSISATPVHGIESVTIVKDSNDKIPIEKEEEIKVTDKIEHFVQSLQEAGKLDSVTSQTLVVNCEDSANQYCSKFGVDDKNITIPSIDINKAKSVTMHESNNINTLDMLTKQMPSEKPQNIYSNANNTNRNENMNATSTPDNQVALGQSPHHRLQTISLFNFGDRAGAPGQPPVPNLPDFLVPPHLITYETSIEINFRKIPPPQLPPQPKFIKKMLVHTESLERRTRAFLSGNFEFGTTDSSLRTARQKIRSLKSTILRSDDEVKHAEDTINKAQSGNFLNIFAPPIVEPPLYEFIEVPSSQRSDDELSENLDRRNELGQSVQKQELENMEDYYSSKYSSRSSRRRVEGK